MRLIGINGFKRSGKDTTFQLIQSWAEAQGLAAERAAFADKLKVMAAMALGLEGSHAELVALMDEAKESWEFSVSRMVEDHVTETAPSRLSPGRTIRMPVTTFTGRSYLQWFGEHARTVFGDDFWVDQVLPAPQPFDPGHVDIDDVAALAGAVANVNRAKLHNRYPGADIVCITDVRYPNEAARVLDLGGEVWEILRPGLESDGHSSEQRLPHRLVTRTIVNSGSINYLGEKVRAQLC